MSANKYDSEKVRVDLLPPFSLWSISEVFTYGAVKYAPWNWAKGIAYSRLYGGILRHLFAWYRGENKDPETGKSHLHHAGCGIMMLIEMEEYRRDLDDRPKHYTDNKD